MYRYLSLIILHLCMKYESCMFENYSSYRVRTKVLTDRQKEWQTWFLLGTGLIEFWGCNEMQHLNSYVYCINVLIRNFLSGKLTTSKSKFREYLSIGTESISCQNDIIIIYFRTTLNKWLLALSHSFSLIVDHKFNCSLYEHKHFWIPINHIHTNITKNTYTNIHVTQAYLQTHIILIQCIKIFFTLKINTPFSLFVYEHTYIHLSRTLWMECTCTLYRISEYHTFIPMKTFTDTLHQF